MSAAQRSATPAVEIAPISWGRLIAATLLAGVTIAVIWFAAVPWGPIVCPAIYPAPRNCFATDRAGTGLIASVVVLLVYVATMIIGLFARHRLALVAIGIGLLAIAPIVSYLAVAWIPGFAL